MEIALSWVSQSQPDRSSPRLTTRWGLGQLGPLPLHFFPSALLPTSHWSLFPKVVGLVTHCWLTLCNPVDSSLPGSSVHGILQARILEWVGFPSPRDLPDPGIKPRSPALQADALPSEPTGKAKHSGSSTFIKAQHSEN